jgi:acetyl-CoA carboxylase biotin carboxyl carrier protein
MSGNADPELIKSVWAEARDLMRRLEGSTVQRLAVSAGGTSIEIERDPSAVPQAQAPAPLEALPPRRASGMMPTVGAGSLGAAEEPAPADGRKPITAPLVGTFYRSATPGADPFVDVGDIIEAGEVVGIVEAMKLMNEVQATAGGKIAEIVAENGQPVEFEQALMYVEPADE